jgi:hypothetical protein
MQGCRRRHDRPAATSLRTDDQIVGYYASRRWRRSATDVPFCIQDFPMTLLGGDEPEGHPAPSSMELPVLRDAEARGLAGPGEDLRRCAASRPDGSLRHVSIL